MLKILNNLKISIFQLGRVRLHSFPACQPKSLSHTYTGHSGQVRSSWWHWPRTWWQWWRSRWCCWPWCCWQLLSNIYTFFSGLLGQLGERWLEVALLRRQGHSDPPMGDAIVTLVALASARQLPKKNFCLGKHWWIVFVSHVEKKIVTVRTESEKKEKIGRIWYEDFSGDLWYSKGPFVFIRDFSLPL